MIHVKRWGVGATTLAVAAMLITQRLHPAAGADVNTDKHMYRQGETMAITGTAFLPSHAITLTVKRPDAVVDTVPNVSTDASGSFAASYIAPGINGSYRITATDGTNTADTHVADPSVGQVSEYSQCSNDLGTGYSSGDTGCRWINGDLQGQNSTYAEGDATVQRVFLKGMTVGTHTLILHYDTTKNGAHAYDFLTDDKYSETWITDSDMCDNANTNGFPTCAATQPAPDTVSIPIDLHAGGIDANAANIGRRHFRIRNGVITGVSTPFLNGSYAGDSDTSITVTFNVNSSCVDGVTDKGVLTCPVLITFGAHVSKKSDWNGAATAVTISGAPYHVQLDQIDTDTLGQRDNQLQTSAVGASLTLVKTVTNDNGGTAVPTDWTLTATSSSDTISGQTGTVAVTSVPVPVGTYALSESGPSGYTPEGWSCVVNGTTTLGPSVTLASGDVAVCTINNNDVGATLTLAKHVINDNGGTAAASAWTLTATGNGGFSGTGLPATGVDASLSKSVKVNVQYTLSESGGPSGYTAGAAWVCSAGTFVSPDKITLAAGQSATCTITNDDQGAFVIVNKVVVNNNGGSAKPDDFKLTLDGTATTSGTKVAVTPGTHTAAETQLAGYTFTGFSGDCDTTGKVTVALGETKTCTLTNDDQQAYVIVNKVVINDNGGSAKPDDFKLTLDGTATTSGTKVAVNPGAHTAAETQLAGYTFTGFSGDCDTTGKVTVALGETKTCTLTNDDQQAYVIVNKVVKNDNGGTAKPDDFKLTLDGTATTSGTKVAVNPGAHTAAETLLAGYTFTGFTGDCDSTGKVTVALGETKSCTLTNDDQQAYVIVNKVVVNDNGGTAKPDDFKLTLAGNATTSGTKVAVNPGTYTAAETLLAGYSFTGFSGDCDSTGKVTVALGETKSCTLTNDDQPAFVIVNKVVVNNNGGTANPNDFKLTLDGTATTSGTKVAVTPGTHTAAETLLAGYSFTGFSGDCDSTGKVTVALGETKTCTLTNDDQQAYVIVNKVVVNNNGGTANPNDFKLTLDGTATTSGTKVAVNPGAHTAAETLLTGYTFTGFTGDCDSTGKVTVALGETKSCTLTNDDSAPQLHLRKIVKNDNGGTAAATDFTLRAVGPTPFDTLQGATPVDSSAGFKAGTYTLSESGPAGYSTTGWVCVGGTMPDATHITVGIGQSATCTITNDDQPARLKLLKAVLNKYGGQATSANFLLTAAGVTGTKSADTSLTLVASGTDSAVNAGVYTLGETSLKGYKFDTLVCIGGVQNNFSLTLLPGQSAVCTFTNEDLPGTIVIKKITDPPNTGSFAFTTTGNGYSPFPLAGGAQNSQILSAGTYTVTESSQLGWILTGIGSDPADPSNPLNCSVTGSGGSTGVGDLNTQSASINLKNGDTVTCVFENTSNGATRTQGFWATHPQLANIAWFGGTGYGHTFPGVANVSGIGDQTLCGRPLDTLPKIMGAFWSDISKTTTGAKRSALDQARMQLLQQLMAAELNASAFGSAPATGTFAGWESAYCGTNNNAIQTAQQQSGSFNSKGDSSTFTPGTAADSKTARTIANQTWWDILP